MDADWLARASLSNAVRSGDVLRFDLMDAATERVWSACQTGWEFDQRCRQFEHEYALNETLEPAWALLSVALIRADGPVLVYPRMDVHAFDSLADGQLPLDRFLEAAIHAARTLGELHRRGWLHGDLQPASFVTAPDGTVMLRSFAHARERRTGKTAAGTMRTDFAVYAAPEVSEGASVDERSDLYAFGITLFRLLTGAMPYKAASTSEWVHAHVAMQPSPPAAFRDDVPAILSDLILKLIGREIEIRRLDDVLAAVSQTGATAIVLIDGPAGVGKTALTEHFTRNARAASRTRTSGQLKASWTSWRTPPASIPSSPGCGTCRITARAR
ncbi:hypothetical protein VL15_04760 [Burkholderia cepacia]|uniref:Protein kinase domain-containing protein n=2 Tax=Burkholderia cepacia TaxID=292 RepID=A0A0J5XD94_BURCE|nr:hypothetical protein VL15_04760 [Burkholderia cepacia]